VGVEANVDGVNRVLRGLVKAFVLAPLLSPYVLRHGLPIESLGDLDLLVGVFGFYVFLYLDFSGYCDIMIGIARLMGFTLPEYFDFPFLARNVSEYWLRVHRSLTLWLTDYVFAPMYRWSLHVPVFGAYPFLALSVSLIVTMGVAGLWHGATPSFVAFGLVHGVALVVVRGYEQVMVRSLGRVRFRRFEEARPVRIGATALTYGFTSLAYAFFVLDLPEVVRLFGRLGETAVRLAP
jgi:D-alanyl-lipoteichoic acid acyltransferase DltB (MBOAT superfamily)